jgi:thymidylate kinase
MAKKKAPKVIELFGLPYAGKTTHARKLVRRLGNEGFLVKMIPDQFWESPVFKTELERDEWSLGKLYTQLIEYKAQNLDFIIVERGAWAQIASLRTHLRTTETTSKEERKKVSDAIRLALSLSRQEDFFVLVDINLDTSLGRDKELSEFPYGKIINPEFLSVAKRIYASILDKLPAERTLIISGEEGTFQESQDKILRLILKHKKKKKANSAS